VDEPEQFLTKKHIYADVYIEIDDEILAGNMILNELEILK
jgi:hypothetical protein